MRREPVRAHKRSPPPANIIIITSRSIALHPRLRYRYLLDISAYAHLSVVAKTLAPRCAKTTRHSSENNPAHCCQLVRTLRSQILPERAILDSLAYLAREVLNWLLSSGIGVLDFPPAIDCSVRSYILYKYRIYRRPYGAPARKTLYYAIAPYLPYTSSTSSDSLIEPCTLRDPTKRYGRPSIPGRRTP